MCGRFARFSTEDGLIRVLRRALPDLDVTSFPPDCTAGFNFAPTQRVLAVGRSKPEHPHRFSMLQWGFVPAYARENSSTQARPAPINARSETVATSGMFRHAFNRRRCLLIADGFYAWQEHNGRKIPHYFALKSGEPFAFAGIYDICRRGDEVLQTCANLTTDANAVVAPVHHRMPVILPADQYQLWCDPDVSGESVRDLLKPFPADLMTAHPVSPRVNNIRNDEASLVVEVGMN